jgi:hypothetical protein
MTPEQMKIDLILKKSADNSPLAREFAW